MTNLKNSEILKWVKAYSAFAYHPGKVRERLDDTARYIDQLETRAGGWQDIESIPRKCRAILVYVKENKCIFAVSWINGRWEIFGGSDRSYLNDEAITHWQPLPVPPEVK